MTPEYDYIIVGGGTAGCVLAARLSERREMRVLLLEAGEPDRNPFIPIPGGAAFTLAAPALGWHRMTEPQAELENRALYLAQGKVLGGSSSVNGMVYTRGAPNDYAEWEAAGVRGWSYDDILPYFLKAEGHADRAAPWHARGGPLAVRKGYSNLGVVDAFLKGAAEIGLPVVDDTNDPQTPGIGYYDWMVGKGQRSSAARNYLKPARTRSNVIIITKASVRRLIFTGDRAVGVDFIEEGDAFGARASREIIVCAGAINTPQLLMLSGVGPADHLRDLGIKTVLDQPLVGANLRNHLSYQLSFRCEAPVSAYKYLSPLSGAVEVAKYVFARKGFLAQAAASAGGFYKSSDAVPHADMQAFMVPFILGGLGGSIRDLLPCEHGLTFFVNQGRPLSTGNIRLRSANPDDAPLLDPRYLSDPHDMRVTIDGVSRIAGIADTQAFRAIGARPVSAMPRTRAEIERSIRSTAGNHYHVAGTCSMGADASSSVVDRELRVHGLQGLRVADASVMPRLLNANLAAPVIMIAERAATFASAQA